MNMIPPIFRWLALAEAVRGELRRFGFSEPEKRYLDALVSCTIARGKLWEQIPRSLLMRMAGLDKFALSRVENSLRWAGVIRLTENKRRADRARSKQGDCPTVEFRLDSKCWFATSGSSGRNRKQLEEISVTDAQLLHKELSELNPVQQVELPPSELEEAYALTLQEYERDRLTEAAVAEVSGRVNDSILADAAGAIPTAAGGREPAGLPSLATAAGGREPNDPFEGDPVGFWNRLRELGPRRQWDWALSNPELAEALAVALNATAPEERAGGAVAPNATASTKPNEIRPPVGAVAPDATASDAIKCTLKALESVQYSKASKVGESEGGAEAVAPNATAPAREAVQIQARNRAAEFVARAYQLFQKAGDLKTLSGWRSYGSWWRFAFIVSPRAAEEAMEDLETRLASGMLRKAGGWAQERYWTFGGQWQGRQQATPSQRERLGAMGVKFYETPYVPQTQARTQP
jgi:hypothetical protein